MTKQETLQKIEELKNFVEEQDKKTYSVGDRFKSEYGEYILATVDYKKVALINLSTGLRWNDGTEVEKYIKITESEFSEISDGLTLTKI